MAAPYEDISDSDEDEDECRVCRGPAEEGRPLFKPCKCSGSIGLTHQDCLTSWLEVTRGDGKCELCSTRFKFAPQYAEGTPDRLSPQEVCFRILRRLGAKWLPRGLRTLLAAILWLIILPLLTSYIYHGWMYRPSAIVSRWNSWELVKRDIVGGVVIALLIVVSFLSLMSFAEFLRFQWGGAAADRERQRAAAAQGQVRRNNRNNNREGGARGVIEGEIDDIIVVHHDEEDDDELDDEIDPLAPFLNHLLTKDEGSVDSDSSSNNNGTKPPSLREENEQNDANNELGINEVQIPADANQDNDEDDARLDDDSNHDDLVHPADNDEEELEAFMRAQEEQDMENEHQQQQAEQDDLPPLEEVPPPPPPRRQRPPRDDARFEPQFEPLQPAFEGADLDDAAAAADDGIDMEVNIAIDELLGFRGPLLALIRNLLWLLVFNTAYLGVFAFAPSKFGGSMYTIISIIMSLPTIQNIIPNNSTSIVGQVWNGTVVSIHELEKKSKELNLIYQPGQIAKMGIGYVSFAILIFMLKTIVTITVNAKKKKREQTTQATPEAQENERIRNNNLRIDAIRENRLDDLRQLERDAAQRNAEQNEAAGKKLLSILECAGAIAKVVILLFIKMLLLPLMLGIWLDLATLSLFNNTWSDRIEYAGIDLFGSIFLHWVAGITFMLLVTVSVLQLREVAHPDILARVIRPQEPQPDLLGNLLQETGVTHTRRVLLSLGIYAALLAVHIWLPARLLLKYNLGQHLPLFQPKFWHILMPQIQVPAELFIFHLCMLGVLEKYKNKIGEMQHHWLLLMGGYLGMTNQILPREVEQFSLVGTLPVFADDATPSQLDSLEEVPSFEGRNDDIYPLWNNMLSESDQTKREEWIRSNISRMEMPATSSLQHTSGIVRDGKKVLSTHSYIRLPSASSTNRLVVKTSDDASSNLLPTSIGPYRLKQGVSTSTTNVAGVSKTEKVTHIEIWKEMVGKPIPRPPEGWDDLGVGGAERHGRWAWGEEHTSEIENSVAVRTPFFKDPTANKLVKAFTLAVLMAKMVLLLFISWAAISGVLCAALNIPLYAGHFALYLLRVPEDCIHDPLAFAMGIVLMVPAIGIIVKLFVASNGLKRVWKWARSFRPRQPSQKVKTLATFFALWLFVCPILLGYFYSSLFVGISDEFIIKSELNEILVDWGTGTLLLNLWAIMCYFQMLTIKFWSDLIIGRRQVNADDEDQPNVGAGQGGRNNGGGDNNIAQGANAANTGESTQGFIWQGQDGIIARVVVSIKAFSSGWEWDKVDKQLLLHDCALPISIHIAIACVVPVAAVLFARLLVNAIGQKLESTIIFRIAAVTTVLLDTINSSKDGLNRWFQAAHKIARDDRYLIGEILLNHPSSTRGVTTSSST